MDKLENAFKLRSKKLNKIEKIKETKLPKETFNKILEYSKNGYESIPKEDLSFFLKSYGIYDRLVPNQFMMRVRVPNGKLNFQQANMIGEIAKEYGNDYIDITTRMQIQLRYLKIENIPVVLTKLESVNLSPFQTGVDNIRNIVSDPLSQFAKDSMIQTDEIVEKMQKFFYKKEGWITVLPRKFNVGINGSFSNRSNIFGQDVAFVLAQKDLTYGFNLYLGGKVGVTAKQTDIFLKDADEVFLVFKTILELFKEFGFRDNRNKNRLHFLIEAVGLKEFEKAIKKRAGKKFQISGKSLIFFDSANQEKVLLKDDNLAKLMIIPSGIFSGTDIIGVSKLLKNSDSEIRLTYEQNLYIVGAKEEKIKDNHIVQKYKKFENPFFENMVACAGSNDCPFGLIPNKSDAINMANHLTENITLSKDSNIRFHWSACPKGCGLHGFGDIGFEGVKVKIDGEFQHGVNIYLGGKMSHNGKEGHKFIRSATLPQAEEVVSSIVELYRIGRATSESFSSFDDRVLSNYSSHAINFLFRFNKKFSDIQDLHLKSHAKSSKVEVSEIYNFGLDIYRKISEKSEYVSEDPLFLIVSKMVESDSSKRYQTFVEVMEDMDNIS